MKNDLTDWHPRVSVPFHTLTWESQVVQYPKKGPAGISLFTAREESRTWRVGDESGLIVIRCLCWRSASGRLRGVLNYFPDGTPFEAPGDFNIMVDPSRQKRGIGLALLSEGIRRWDIDLKQQRYTPGGAALVESWLRANF